MIAVSFSFIADAASTDTSVHFCLHDESKC